MSSARGEGRQAGALVYLWPGLVPVSMAAAPCGAGPAPPPGPRPCSPPPAQPRPLISHVLVISFLCCVCAGCGGAATAPSTRGASPPTSRGAFDANFFGCCKGCERRITGCKQGWVDRYFAVVFWEGGEAAESSNKARSCSPPACLPSPHRPALPLPSPLTLSPSSFSLLPLSPSRAAQPAPHRVRRGRALGEDRPAHGAFYVFFFFSRLQLWLAAGSNLCLNRLWMPLIVFSAPSAVCCPAGLALARPARMCPSPFSPPPRPPLVAPPGTDAGAAAPP